MLEIDLALVRQHLKADDEDVEDELIQQYIESAVSICESYCNRKFYDTEAKLDEDQALAITELAAAKASRNAGIEATENGEVLTIIGNTWFRKYASILARCNGVVVDGTIMAAILMTVGRLYKVRQDVAAGQSVSGVQMPEGARRILEPYLWIGELGGGS
jgi:hypothetical protein